MANYFRLQIGHYTLDEMQSYTSEDGGDDGGTEGLCACQSIGDLLHNTVWDLAGGEGAEVVIFKGQRMAEIYDGVRVYPTAIVVTMTTAEFDARVADESIYEYEEW